ncbi:MULTISPECIES: type VII secretion protein EssB [unclassified Enterococcus]|uniref:type VII secretion protein EssB n=1 Tax=unclassified Enterococcus TaxID=2608891 RepID=UPI001557C6AB|nr:MULTISPECIES: type VII secretion protein EssB [unclassified Enterococcus]MBS7576413.1 type VII secretion protein EssB [Enterococcus sp. MMGLQ5-2]MBS7583645.1 type VII secretion protein EssB [Enterococcus sp. MMGLQ5-1]NPD11506.1 type VII secretion protein EssB [Enterococcus sp. MMGLQ5-1]NPD36250.1 type VII secretion protein EssB [Enterococcus sp. MMGLQ5-2]
MKLFNGEETLELVYDNQEIKVTISKNQYQAESLKVIQEYTDAEETENDLNLKYHLPEGAISFSNKVLSCRTRLEKLRLADKISQLAPLLEKYKIPFIHPENIYFDGEHLMVVHFGLQDILAPMKADNQLLLKNIKALILTIFNSKLGYEKLLDGSVALNDKFAQALIPLETPEQVFSFVNAVLTQEIQKTNQTQRFVPKKSYRFYRLGGILAIIIAIISVGFLVYFSKTNQRQTAIIDSQTSFLTNNYAKAQSTLKEYSPNSLPKSAKYVLAISSINLTDLTDTQKESILNNISIKSDDNTLDYWIYYGRGNFDKALNLAQNLGDDQLTLLAYADLYQATKLDDKMDGAKKQKLLADYKKQIDELTEKLGK